MCLVGRQTLLNQSKPTLYNEYLLFMLARIIKDVPADSKEGRQALHSSVAGDPLSQETASPSLSV